MHDVRLVCKCIVAIRSGRREKQGDVHAQYLIFVERLLPCNKECLAAACGGTRSIGAVKASAEVSGASPSISQLKLSTTVVGTLPKFARTMSAAVPLRT